MAKTEHESRVIEGVEYYCRAVARLAGEASTTEATYYPLIRTLVESLLRARGLPFDVRSGTSETRPAGGTDLPDLALYDGSGDFVVVFLEVKLPAEDLAHLTVSTARGDQVGRYLAQTGVVVLSNVREYGLLTAATGWEGEGPVPPAQRRLEQRVELWPSKGALEIGQPPALERSEELADLIETAVTRFAPIGEPESLAKILARQARHAKADLPPRFSQAVAGLLEDFGKALGITFEGPEGEEFFRSSLIQTAFYGLFAGWALWRHAGSAGPFRWEELSKYLKIPFLGQLFYEFRHPARIKELRLGNHLDVATETLERVDADRFFARFALPGLTRPEKDHETLPASAITYFYEPFLEAFDPDLRKELGVWYTPPEIVEYQVRKIDSLLREELGCSRGFADERVFVLDPGCGTGAYLIEIMRSIADELRQEGDEALLGAKLREACCRRVMGFEILTAPFVVAQLQLYLHLAELGAAPDEEHRPAVFLTNALTGWDGDEQLKLHFPELQEEHDAAQRIKTEGKIIVLLGNPPYNRFAGVPLAEERDLVDHYKGIRRDAKGKQVGPTELYKRWGVRKHLLDDLYIRFFRLAEKRIGEEADFGVVSLISNYSFLAGRSHPLMRESLLARFGDVWIDSLNGDKYRTGKVVPDGLPGAGTSDQSIFTTDYDSRGIQVGTSISTFLKRPSEKNKAPGVVHYRDFWGQANRKRQALLDSLRLGDWSEGQKVRAAAQPEGPREYEEFTPSEKTRWKLVPYEAVGGYEEWPALDELFPTSFQGVNPNRGLEGSVIDTDRSNLERRMAEYFSELSFEELLSRHPEIARDRARYDAHNTRKILQQRTGLRKEQMVPYQVFPLDLRWIYYETRAKLLNERRPELWHNLSGNEFLVTVPEPRRASEYRPVVATTLFDLHLHDRGSVGFPATVRMAPDLFNGGGAAASANLAASVWQRLAAAWDLPGSADRDPLEGEPAKRMVSELFRFCLAICHAPAYELDHRDSLAQDWAHVPLPRDRRLFDEICGIGERVAALLDPAADARPVLEELLGKAAGKLARVRRKDGKPVRAEDLGVTYSYFGAAKGCWLQRRPGPGEPWEEPWGELSGDLFLNDEVFLGPVPEKVWSYQLGGYPVLKKWLGYRDAKRRNGAPLALSEVDHLRGMVQRLAALLVLHSRLDRLYEQATTGAFTAEELGLR